MNRDTFRNTSAKKIKFQRTTAMASLVKLSDSYNRLIADYTKLEEQYRDLEANYHAVCAHKVTLALERKKKV